MFSIVFDLYSIDRTQTYKNLGLHHQATVVLGSILISRMDVVH